MLRAKFAIRSLFFKLPKAAFLILDKIKEKIMNHNFFLQVTYRVKNAQVFQKENRAFLYTLVRVA